MKTSAMIRIIVWSLIAILLIGVLVVSIRGDHLLGINLNFGNSIRYENKDLYDTGSGSIPADQISSLEVNWVSGSVNVIEYDGEELTFQETGRGSLSQKDQLRYYAKDGKLIIQFCEPRGLFHFWNSSLDKSLEIKIPKSISRSLQQLKLSSTSASIQIGNISAVDTSLESVSGAIIADGINCRTLDIECVSGGINAHDISATKADIENVSGSTNVSGALEAIDHESVSGKVDFLLNNCPSKLNASL